MSPRQQEVGKNDDAICALLNTAIEGDLDRGVRQFHVGWLDDLNSRGSAKDFDHINEQSIALLTAGTVIDHNHATILTQF
jgi:hypothetical protein